MAQSSFLSEFQQEKHYYDSLLLILGPDSMQGTGYNQFQRSYNYWSGKLSPDYDYVDYQNDLLNYSSNYTAPQNFTRRWHLIGPNDIPKGIQAKGTGQIHYIYQDRENIDNYYACSPVGGLFHMSSESDYWENMGTDKGLPRCGVSSVINAFHTLNSYYVTTGNGEGFRNKKIWQTAIGVWRTMDNGNTWDNIGLNTDPGSGDTIYGMRKVIGIEHYSDSVHLIVTTTEGLFETHNAIASNPVWSELIDGEFYDVVQDLADTNIIYASGSNNTGVYKYDLSNHTATRIFDVDTLSLPSDTMIIREPERRRFSLNISPAADSLLFAVFSMRDYNYTAVFRYNVNTGEWHRFEINSGFNGYERKMGWAIRPMLNDSSQLQILGRDDFSLFLFYNGLSNDSVARTKVIRPQANASTSPHDDFHYLMIEASDSIIWAGTDGGVYKGVFVNDTIIDWETKSYGLGVSTIHNIDVSSTGKLATSGQFDCASNTYKTDDESIWDITTRYGGDGYQNIVVSDDMFYMSHNDGGITRYDNNTQTILSMGSHDIVHEDCTEGTKQIPNSNFATYYIKVGNNLYGTGTKELMKYYSGDWHNWSDFNSQIGCAISGTWKVAAKDFGGTHQIYTSTYQYPGGVQYVYKSLNGGGPNLAKWAKVEGTPMSGWINALLIANNPDSLVLSVRDKIFAVNTSAPSSPAWHDISFSLDAGTVNSIVWSNGRTWIAAERGVFYLEDGANAWVDYSDNLPNCEISDIKVKNNRVYAGTFGRGLWFASTPVCGNIVAEHVTSDGEHVGAGITKTFFGDVRVPTGNVYTIYGTVEMAADCKIIVERGAKLIIDGGTITKACPDFWPGIELWGNSNAAQDTINQGWVIIKNGGTIEYAKTGIETVRIDSLGKKDLSYAGGVVQADNAVFYDNTTSVSLLPYPKSYAYFPILNNESYFKKCSFVWDTAFYEFGGLPQQHVLLTETRGVALSGNIFINKLSRKYPFPLSSGEFGMGIASWNSGFYVAGDGIDPNTANTFRNLDYGIRTFAYFGANKPIKIEYNLFEHNKTACYLSAETFAAINRNKFVIKSGITSITSDGYSGLYLDACTGYQVEENEFYSNYQPLFPSSYSRSYGLVVNNSGPEDNLIYNNDFHNLGWATQAQETNRGKVGTGLTIKCNDYTDNYQDINVTQIVINSSNGVKHNQGSDNNDPTAPAGNTFSHIGNPAINIYSDFSNNCADITYWHHYPNLGTPYLVPVYHTPAPLVVPQNNPHLIPFNKSTACPSNLVTRTYNNTKSYIVAAKSSLTVYADSLTDLVDAGNTTATNLDVVTSMPPETMQLRDQLLDASPYLSETVMVNAAEKEDVLPNSIITEILSENPQSAKSDKVLDKLNERDNPPDDNQMAQIHTNDTVIGHKESLESKKAYYTGEEAKEAYRLVRMYGQDTGTTSVYDSIETALSNIHSPESFYLQAFCRFNKGDSAGVVNVVNNIVSEFDLTATENVYNTYFGDYFNVLLSLRSENKPFSAIDTSQKAVLYDIMNNTNGILPAYARGLLIHTDGCPYSEPYIENDTASMKAADANNEVVYNYWPKDAFFKLYPNPADNYITLEYDLNYRNSNAVVEIVSLTGIHLETYRLQGTQGVKIIDLRRWKTGAYIIRLTLNGKTLQNEKFVKF